MKKPLVTLAFLALGWTVARKFFYSGARFPFDRPRVTLVFGATHGGYYSPANPHKGVDLAPYPGSLGATVYACWPMIVGNVGEHPTAGNYIISFVEFPMTTWAKNLSGDVRTIPAGTRLQVYQYHFQSVHKRVQIGAKLRPGDEIGKNGSTGKSSGPHLHLEVRLGDERLDPLDLLITTIPGLQAQLIYADGAVLA